MADVVIRELPDEVLNQLNAIADFEDISPNDLLQSLICEAVDERSQEVHAVRNKVPCLPFPEDDGDSLSPLRSSPGLPFSFIDLFSGIGGLRLGLEAVGGRCLFSCENDKHAQKTYESWFGENPAGDVTEISQSSCIPDHDLLAAGFPCQPFSIAGVSKKNSLGRDHGFRDRTQGTMFFHLAEIIDRKQPPVILLENVKNLQSHDQGRTWQTITSTLDELGYVVFHQIVDAADYVPQHRERIFIVGFRRDLFGDSPRFTFPVTPPGPRPRLKSILESSVDPKYTLSDKLWNYLQDYAEKHRKRGNGFGFGIASPTGITRTLSARYHKDGAEILVAQNGSNPRRLTPTEAGRLMGFPDHLANRNAQIVSDTQAYRQFGNSVVPLVVAAVARQIVSVMQTALINRSANGCLLKNA